MAKTLNINVVNKVATYCQRGGDIVCGNSDYVIDFTFDAEWDAHPVKTARFIVNGKHTDVVFEGKSVAVPVIKNAQSVAVGVFAGNLKTTTPAVIACQKSILCEDGAPTDPAPDVYNQIIDLLNHDWVGDVTKIENEVTDHEERLNDLEANNPPGVLQSTYEMLRSFESAGVEDVKQYVDEATASLPIPTLNTEKKLDGEGYYIAYAWYMGFWHNFGLFYYVPSQYSNRVYANYLALDIAPDGTLSLKSRSASVNDSGNVVETWDGGTYDYYGIYTAKL